MSKQSSWSKLKAEYKASLKSADTEEHIDLCFYRPIGFAWAYIFRKLHVSPNAVTIASIFIGVFAGVCMYPVNIWINIAGILLLIWANSYDSADGQLARLTKQYSQLGRILDGMAGDFWFISIYVAICLRTVHTIPFFAEHAWAIWVIAVLAGVCHALQAAVADSYRQFHLLLLKGTAGSELDSTEELERRYRELSWKRDFGQKLVQFFYIGYTRRQESLSPAMQTALRRRYPDGQLPADVRERFRAWSFPLCKWENFMTFNWRSIFLFVTLLAGQPWLYFVAELTVFNIVLVYTIVTHERICRRMTASLE